MSLRTKVIYMGEPKVEIVPVTTDADSQYARLCKKKVGEMTISDLAAALKAVENHEIKSQKTTREMKTILVKEGKREVRNFPHVKVSGERVWQPKMAPGKVVFNFTGDYNEHDEPVYVCEIVDEGLIGKLLTERSQVENLPLYALAPEKKAEKKPEKKE